MSIRLINAPLLANPFNWIFVAAVFLLVGLSLSLIVPASGNAKTQSEN